MKNSKLSKLLYFSCLISLTFLLQDCGVYSFSGTNIDPRIQTISISNFINEASLGPPDLSQRFTESLKQFFQNNTKLRLVNSGGDLQLEGSIVGYEVSPAAPTADNRAALNRLIIRVNVSFVNTYNEKEDFEKVFASQPGDFNASTSLQSVESSLVPELLDQIVLDIFNQTVTNW